MSATVRPSVQHGADLLLSRLENTKRSGKGWIARCPAHADRSASLSLTESDDGKTLVHCFAGCEAKAIVEAVRLTLADLFESGTYGQKNIFVLPTNPTRSSNDGPTSDRKCHPAPSTGTASPDRLLPESWRVGIHPGQARAALPPQQQQRRVGCHRHGVGRLDEYRLHRSQKY